MPLKDNLSKSDIDDYVKRGYGTCPFCDSNMLDSSGIEADGNTAWSETTCNDCGAIWEDIYELKTVEVIQGPQEED